MRRFLLVAILVCVSGAQEAQARTLNGPAPQPTIGRADKTSPGFFYGGGGGAGKVKLNAASKGPAVTIPQLDAASKDPAYMGITNSQSLRFRAPEVRTPHLR